MPRWFPAPGPRGAQPCFGVSVGVSSEFGCPALGGFGGSFQVPRETVATTLSEPPLPSGEGPRFGRWRGVELFLYRGAGGKGDYQLSGAGDLFAGGENDYPGRLALDAENAEAAEFDSGTGDQADEDVVEEGLEDLASEVQGKAEPGGDGFDQVVLDHGVSGHPARLGSRRTGRRCPWRAVPRAA